VVASPRRLDGDEVTENTATEAARTKASERQMIFTVGPNEVRPDTTGDAFRPDFVERFNFISNRRARVSASHDA
jgi:hypothetical protein